MYEFIKVHVALCALGFGPVDNWICRSYIITQKYDSPEAWLTHILIEPGHKEGIHIQQALCKSKHTETRI